MILATCGSLARLIICSSGGAPLESYAPSGNPICRYQTWRSFEPCRPARNIRQYRLYRLAYCKDRRYFSKRRRLSSSCALRTGSNFEVSHPWPRRSLRPAVFGPLLFLACPQGALRCCSRAPKFSSGQIDHISHPRTGWQSTYVGAWFNDSLDDSIYPYAFTVSGKPLHLEIGTACVIVIARGGAALQTPSQSYYFRSPGWSKMSWRGPLRILPRGFTAVAGLAQQCVRPRPAGKWWTRFCSFDPSWRMRTERGWESPSLVDGWAMGWQTNSGRLVYLPAVAQGASLLLDVIFLACWSRHQCEGEGLRSISAFA